MTRRKKDKAKLALWTLLLAAVAVGALVGVSALRRRQRPAWAGGYSVHISEVMTDNLYCPNEQGVLCDWVEIENTTARPFALGGYYLSDAAGEGKYRFPAGTTVPARGYLLVWCSAGEGGDYAPFALKKEGGESVCLMNPSRVVLDEAVTVPCAPGQSLIRGEGGALAPTDTPTPGYPNNEAGARAWSETAAQRLGGTLELSEIMSSNSLYAAPDGTCCDWIEVRNPTDHPVALAGYKLSDREEKTKYSFPENRTLGPGEYMVIWCVTGGTGEDAASFALASAGGETVVLTAPSGTAADSVLLPPLEKNTSYSRTESGWIVTDRATPGYPNDEAGYQAYLRAGGYEDTAVYITEVLGRNKALCTDEDGDFSDWIELANLGSVPADLTGWYLSDQEDMLNKWAIPSLTLAPGEYLRIWASGKNRTAGEALHTSFSLSEGETVFLSTPAGTRLRSVTWENVPEGASLVYTESGDYRPSDYPTPGYPNTAAGYEAFCAADTRTSPLLIWETAVYDPDHSDWVELRNVSGGEIELSNYTLTDRRSDPARMTLPAATLAPGESVVVECRGFGLNAQRDELYLFDRNGTACDWTMLRSIPLPGSYGRLDGENGFFYFTEPTPGGENGRGWRMVSAAPAADTAPGVYRDVDSLTVTLSGENIHYTTDGSTPTEASPAYTGPITVTETTVLRAVSLPAGQLPGDVLTLSYFLHEESTLPVVSLVTDSENLFGRTGIYDRHEQAWEENWEREASVAFFEEDGGFTMDCGIRIHGRTSRRTSDKRSFRLAFRGRYGGTLDYDIFGDGAVTEFSSLLLRASVEDNYTSYMRDELFARLAMDNTDVPAQNYRYVTLYINGEYWGIYAIREHHSDHYFASHTGVEADTVDMQTGEFRNPGPWSELLSYAENNDLSGGAGWEYIQQHVDVPEMIDWLILECWSGDIDVYENVRFYASPDFENGRYLYGLVDMDLTMMGHDTYTVGFNNIAQLHGIIPVALLSNREFKDMFLTRLGELLQGPLSDESVLAQIDALQAVVEPETARDLQRWGRDGSLFAVQMQHLRSFTNGRAAEMVSDARTYFGLSDEQLRQYFGALAN